MASTVRSVNLPRFLLMKSTSYSGDGYVYSDEDGSAVLGEKSVFSPLVKIEVERSTTSDNFFNLRFCFTNKYWSREENEKYVVARSNTPQENIINPSCTLFEANPVDGSYDEFFLIHTQSGGLLMKENSTMSLYVAHTPQSQQSCMSFVDWDTIVKLPKNVAFKGYNGQYLKAELTENHNYLQFKADDPNAEESRHVVYLMPDGHVQIKSKHSNCFWWRNPGPDWIWGDSRDTTASDVHTLFWPFKIDANTIALRNKGNHKFCKPVSKEGKTNCLNAHDSTITKEARIGVEDLVLNRNIYNVRYRMEDARIYNQKPYTAGTTTAINDTDSEVNIAVALKYEDSKTYSFSHSESLTLGIKTNIECNIPWIVDGKIEVGLEFNGAIKWDESTTTTTSVTATGSVRVPANCVATIDYVATKGTCDVPFSYTQKDQSSTDGSFIQSDENDGVITSVSCYNFKFVVHMKYPGTLFG